MSKPRWRTQLEPFDALYQQLYREIIGRIEDMSDEDVDALYRATNGPSRTNCGWTMYRAAGIVRHEIEKMRVRRQRLAEAALANEQ